MSLTLTSGDTGPKLAGTISAATTGASALVNVKRADFTVVSRAATTLVDNGDGTSNWTLDLATGDLTVGGGYWLEVQVTFSNGQIQTFAKGTDNQSVQFVVRAQIA